MDGPEEAEAPEPQQQKTEEQEPALDRTPLATTKLAPTSLLGKRHHSLYANLNGFEQEGIRKVWWGMTCSGAWLALSLDNDFVWRMTFSRPWLGLKYNFVRSMTWSRALFGLECDCVRSMTWSGEWLGFLHQVLLLTITGNVLDSGVQKMGRRVIWSWLFRVISAH